MSLLQRGNVQLPFVGYVFDCMCVDSSQRSCNIAASFVLTYCGGDVLLQLCCIANVLCNSQKLEYI